MAKYRKKPVVIEAWCVNDLITAVFLNKPLPDAVAEMVAVGIIKIGEHNGLSVLTKEGRMHANASDMLIRGVAGEFYPCKPDIFAATYEGLT